MVKGERTNKRKSKTRKHSSKRKYKRKSKRSSKKRVSRKRSSRKRVSRKRISKRRIRKKTQKGGTGPHPKFDLLKKRVDHLYKTVGKVKTDIRVLQGLTKSRDAAVVVDADVPPAAQSDHLWDVRERLAKDGLDIGEHLSAYEREKAANMHAARNEM